LKFRLYIDEVGNPGLEAAKDPRHRYLSDIAFERIEDLKRKYFHYHVDEPLIFYRKKIVNQKYPFHALRNARTRRAFDDDLLQLLDEVEYTMIAVVIDKLEQ
jgi:hypothetical protein